MNAPPAKLTVVTYNLWHGLDPKGTLRFREYETREEREKRLEGFLAHARAADADVLLLQEVNPADSRTRAIARALDFDAVWGLDNAGIKIGPVGLPANFRSGLAILARKGLGLTGLGRAKLSGKPGQFTGRLLSFQLSELRYLLAARIQVGAQPVILANTHLHHGPEVTIATQTAVANLVGDGVIGRARGDEILATIDRASARRRAELGRAMEFLAAHGAQNTPVIFGGDFNASPDAAEIAWLTGAMNFLSVTRDAGEEFFPTWDWERNPNTHRIADFTPVNTFGEAIDRTLQGLEIGLSRRIDYIFTRGLPAGWRVEEAGPFAREAHEDIWTSDHIGVMARVEVGDRK
ncbi:endonuclease/exonuclease/phosphatase family protein [bacterium]|nr:endonuclease/exonuclease/phosphatase family protein [bacterium]